MSTAKFVLNSDIIENECNIVVSSFTEPENYTEEVDIEKHNAQIVIKQNHLRAASDDCVADL